MCKKKLIIYGLVILLCSNYNYKTTISPVFAEFNDNSKDQPVEVNDTVFLLNALVLDSVFSGLNFTLQGVKSTKKVPRVYVYNISKSLKNIKKGQNFIKIILPNALKVNEDIINQRETISAILKKEDRTTMDNKYIEELLVKYRIKDESNLLNHINTIPPSLIIAQAILESGWGRSHFAYEGNCLFGEHAKIGSRNSIAAANGKIALRSYSSIYNSIYGYAKNLNRHNAYKAMRKKRNTLLKEGKTVDGVSLAKTLIHYSENGNSYINTLLSVIRSNNLLEFDNCELTTGKETTIYITNNIDILGL